MSSSEQKGSLLAEPAPAEAASNGHGLLDRERLLGFAGKLKETEVELEDVGSLLVGELSGIDRAEILGKQAETYRDGKLDIVSYQKALIGKGVLDPGSPPGSRTPMLRAADVDQVMRLGGGTVTKIVDAIERLSGLGQHAAASAEGNSVPTPSDGSTS